MAEPVRRGSLARATLALAAMTLLGLGAASASAAVSGPPASQPVTATTSSALSPAAAQAGPTELRVEFVGNAAFRITDGATTLLTDFPYRSGAFGYMSYDVADVGPIVDGVSLISHEHDDHWAPELFDLHDLKLIAHPDIAAGVDAERRLGGSGRVVYKDIVVEPVATEHTDAHLSYLVTWHGVRMYFTGDTEGLTELLAQDGLTVAFVTPWLAERLVASGRQVDAEHLVIYHHLPGERRAAPAGAVWPRQGEMLRFAAR